MTNHEENQLIASDKNVENDFVNLLNLKVITVHRNAVLAIKNGDNYVNSIQEPQGQR